MEGEKQLQNQTNEVFPADGQNTEYNSFSSGYSDKRTAKEKITVGVVLIVAFFAIILGISQFSRAIKMPFAYLLKDKVDESQCIDGDCDLQAEILAVLAQQQKDTDTDGLSDYDELNIYNTSPFLEDSDSDGFSDKQEVDSGHDPNCPGSDDCLNGGTPVVDPSANTANGQAMLSGQSTPQELRAFLLQRGFPQETLDAISDEDIMLAYNQVLSGGDPNFDAVVSPSPTQDNGADLSQLDEESLKALQSLTGAQIRELMIAQGAPESVLSQVGDDELKAMFLSQLEAKSNN